MEPVPRFVQCISERPQFFRIFSLIFKISISCEYLQCLATSVISIFPKFLGSLVMIYITDQKSPSHHFWHTVKWDYFNSHGYSDKNFIWEWNSNCRNSERIIPNIWRNFFWATKINSKFLVLFLINMFILLFWHQTKNKLKALRLQRIL